MIKFLLFFLCFILSLNNNIISGQTTDSKKTIVQIGIYLNHIEKIDVKAQTFYAEFYLNMKWKGTHSPSTFELINSNDFQKYFYEEWFEKDTSWLTCKIRGTFRCKMDVSSFPLDEQNLLIQISDFVWIEDSLTYVVNPEVTGKYKNIYSAEWGILDYGAKVVTLEEMDTRYSVFQYSVMVERKTTSFMIKILIPILIVMGVSMLNLFINKKELETCIALGVTSLLSIIALYFSISGNLPEVNYATTVDKMMMGSYLVIFISMIEIVITHNLIERKNGKLLIRIERISKLIIPVWYILFLIFIFLKINLLWFLR
jgi:branched-chain amino acid transport system substrate-binding protein